MGFENFWSAWPEKIAKVDAEKAWNQVHPSPDLEVHIVSNLERQIRERHQLLQLGLWVPNWPRAGKWLRGWRWEDEPSPALRMSLATPEQVRAQADLQALHEDAHRRSDARARREHD